MERIVLIIKETLVSNTSIWKHWFCCGHVCIYNGQCSEGVKLTVSKSYCITSNSLKAKHTPLMKQLLGHIIKRFAYIYCPSLTHIFPIWTISGIVGYNVIHVLFCDNVFEYQLRCFRTQPEVSYWPSCRPDSLCHRIRHIVTD